MLVRASSKIFIPRRIPLSAWLGNEFETIKYRFKRNFLHEARRVTSLSLRKASPIDYAPVRGSPKRSMSLGGPRVAAAKQEPATT